MKRRELVLSLAGCGVLISANQAMAQNESYRISQADVEKVPQKYRRRLVGYSGDQKPGTIIVDTRNRFLFLIQPGGKAIRYGIGVGRQGFSWSRTAIVRRKAKCPKWTPPAAMVQRDRLAAKWASGMPGGPGNPLGARALDLFQGEVGTLYRLHGTFDPSSIGKAVSSGRIRMMINADVADLYERVAVGACVIVRQNETKIAEDRSEERRKRKGLLEILFSD